ncbi:MAG: DsrE/DsrF/DrsH-like family protein [Thermodesulfobacteriota bacterium]
MSEEKKDRAAFICSRDTLDGAYPALILGLNTARQGLDTKVFYTFMGLNLLKKGGIEKAKFIPAGVMGAIPGMSLVATSMMKGMIDKANVPNLPELLEMAQLEGVGLIACKMTVDMMGLKEEDLIEGVKVWTAEEFLKYATEAKINLFT